MRNRGDVRRAVVGLVRRALIWSLLAGVLLLPAGAGASDSQATIKVPKVDEYVVLYAAGVAPGEARAAIAAAGGTILRENLAVGVATVRVNRHDGRFRQTMATCVRISGANTGHLQL